MGDLYVVIKNMKNSAIVVLFSILAVSCGRHVFPVAVSSIVSRSNDAKIAALSHEVGRVLVFEIRAEVKTGEGLIIKKERVEAKIIGHKEFAGSVVRVFDTNFSSNKKIEFTDGSGSKLIIPSRNASDLGKEYDGALDYLIAGYVDGQYVSVRELRSRDSLQRHGFQLLSYIAPKIKDSQQVDALDG